MAQQPEPEFGDEVRIVSTPEGGGNADMQAEAACAMGSQLRRTPAPKS